MALKYKALWQEARQEADRLAAELERIHQVVDLAGIARHMHVERFTPQQWRQRGQLPPSDFPEITGEPLWYASTIRDGFAHPTGRMWCPSPTSLHAAGCEVPHTVTRSPAFRSDRLEPAE